MELPSSDLLYSKPFLLCRGLVKSVKGEPLTNPSWHLSLGPAAYYKKKKKYQAVLLILYKSKLTQIKISAKKLRGRCMFGGQHFTKFPLQFSCPLLIVSISTSLIGSWRSPAQVCRSHAGRRAARGWGFTACGLAKRATHLLKAEQDTLTSQRGKWQHCHLLCGMMLGPKVLFSSSEKSSEKTTNC